MIRLSLDHLTAVDSTPIELIDLAAQNGCDGVCMFLQPMSVLPHMPHFDILGDQSYRRQVRNSLLEFGISLDLVYPFTISTHTSIQDFDKALDVAAYLGARFVNVLIYDRDAIRRSARFGAFCERAAEFGLGVVVEFYPISKVQTLGDALTLVSEVNRPGSVGLNVDVLHLMRSGGGPEDLCDIPSEFLLFAQLCDGPLSCTADEIEHEASSCRLLPGCGAFDLPGFVARLPDHCLLSVEIPRCPELEAGIPASQRVATAIAAVRSALPLK
jgi:sugar phosphate isomerase/epimerase